MLFGRTLLRPLLLVVLSLVGCCAGSHFRGSDGQFLRIRPSLKNFPRVPRIGLINEHCTDEVYSTKLDFSTADALVGDRTQLLAALDKDAEALGITREQYLANVGAAMRHFVESRQLCDREEVQAAVSAVLSDGKGNFGLLLGGKSTGKSLMLERFVDEIWDTDRGSVLLIDTRKSGSDLTEGIKQALAPEDWKTLMSAVMAAAGVSGDVAMPVVGAAIRALLAPFRIFAERNLSPMRLIQRFVEMHNKRGRTPCIIVDEANLALADGSPGELKQTKAVLELLTALTKQDQKLNVLLACSEHAEPFRLRQLGFNTINFTTKIFAGEVPPAKMLELLKLLKFGDNLAGLLVGIYGGHIWTLYHAVIELSADPNFTPLCVLPSNTISRVDICVRDEEAKQEGMGGVKKLLRELAETGFVPLPNEADPRAERLSRDNIAGVVSKNSVSVGIPPYAWRGRSFGLVPTTHYTRLLIAKALNLLDKDTEEKTD